MPLARQLAPPPTPLQSFEYHWKHVKNFYEQHKVMPKVHIENTNLPTHLEEMLKLLIEEDSQANAMTMMTLVSAEAKTIPATTAPAPAPNSSATSKRECFEFVLLNRPLDLLTDICLTDSPVGASVCVLNWMRRFLTCLQHPRLDHKSILQPTQKLVAYCSSAAGRASPYEQEEIVFLLNVAGVIRKEPRLLHLFLPAHEHSWAVASLNPSLGMKAPVKNTLFENAQVSSNVRRVSLLQDSQAAAADGQESEVSTSTHVEESTKTPNEYGHISCDCTENDSFVLLDTILRYFDSAVSDNQN